MNKNIFLNLEVPIILASASPRRSRLLSQIGMEFEVVPSLFDEDSVPHSEDPVKYAEFLSYEKANEVRNRLNRSAVYIGADTIVVLDGNILNKPLSSSEAVEMLQRLSGRTHIVYTGVTVLNTKTGIELTKSCKTEVTFREINIEEINAYVAGGSPMDKAGAYGIQDDYGAVFVSHINGCYYNIVGLPLEMLYSAMKCSFK